MKAFVLLIITLLCANGIYKSLQYSEKLWPPDEGHEKITISAANGFAEQGFNSNFGLPDFGYPGTPRIYTHLPPGPYWLTGIFVRICDSDKLSCPRILSTIISSLALLFFASMLFCSLGPLKTAVLMFFVAIIPMTRNMIYTLHYANYTFSLFIIQIGFLLYFFKKKISLNIFSLIILFTLGFIQGWFSFEYFFLISLSSLPLALLYSQLDQKEDKKRLIIAILLLVIGFCFAFLLHFFQNSLYFGSMLDAFSDLLGRGRDRLSSQPVGWTRKIDRVNMSLAYFFVYSRHWYFFIINFPVFLSLVLILIWFNDISLKMKTPIKVNIKWVSPRRNYFVILTAFLASFLWIFIMFNHAAAELPHLPRILFFFYFVCILTVLECISLDNS